MARYRTYSVEFKRQVAEEYLSGGTSLNRLARRHDISRELLRTWVRKKYEAGEFVQGERPGADRRADAAKIAGLERRVGHSPRWSSTCSKGGWPRHAGRGACPAPS